MGEDQDDYLAKAVDAERRAAESPISSVKAALLTLAANYRRLAEGDEHRYDGKERRKPLIRAQFYQEEAQKLRAHAETEQKESRRKTLLELADSYEETAKVLIEQAKGIRRKT